MDFGVFNKEGTTEMDMRHGICKKCRLKIKYSEYRKHDGSSYMPPFRGSENDEANAK